MGVVSWAQHSGRVFRFEEDPWGRPTVNQHSTVTHFPRPTVTHLQEGGTGEEVSEILFFSAKSKRRPSLIYSILHRPSNQPIFTSIFDKTYLDQYVEEISEAICESPYGCEFRLG